VAVGSLAGLLQIVAAVSPEPPRRRATVLLFSLLVVSGGPNESEALAAGGYAPDLLRVIGEALLDPLALLGALRDSGGGVIDFVYRDLNQATCDYLGMAREDLLGRGLLEMSPGLVEVGLFASYVRCLETGEPVVRDDITYDNEILADSRRYDLRATRATPSTIAVTWRDVTDRYRTAQLLSQARESQRRADLRYRRLMDSAGVAMGLLAPDGHFQAANQSICDFFGYDADTLRVKTWQELTAPEHLEADLQNVQEVLAGRIESYRMTKQYIHADGHPIWGDLSVSCLRRPGGELESFVVQIVDITEDVKTRRKLAVRDRQNRLLARRLQVQTKRLTAELRSAADYVASILPGEMEGPVRVTALYLPSQELAGDIFDYRWIDSDHLVVYLIDVSGHGVGPALMSVSVHNLIRSGSLSMETLLAPEQVLTELNGLFDMDHHDDHYLTMWYGVYEMSSRTLRYASAGAPPAFVITSGATSSACELSTAGQPLGMFDNADYTAHSHPVPPGCRMLLFSDGAYEDARLEGHEMSLANFKDLFTRMAGSSLEDLAETLRSLTPSGTFTDDCTLLRLECD